MRQHSEFIETAKPILVLFAVLSGYSLIINCLFGHKTYWRSLRNIKKWLIHAYRSCRKLLMPVTQKETAALQLGLLEHDVSMHMLSYLSPYDILQLMQTCQSQLQQCQRPHVWQQLFDQAVSKLRNRTSVEISQSLSKSPLPPHRAYFSICKDAIAHIAEHHNVCCVFIHGNLYDVTAFLAEHPGGASILLDYVRRDATREFQLANHSYIALDLARSLLVVSHVDVFGHKGWPAFVSRPEGMRRKNKWFG